MAFQSKLLIKSLKPQTFCLLFFSTYSIPFITFARTFQVELWRSKTHVRIRNLIQIRTNRLTDGSGCKDFLSPRTNFIFTFGEYVQFSILYVSRIIDICVTAYASIGNELNLYHTEEENYLITRVCAFVKKKYAASNSFSSIQFLMTPTAHSCCHCTLYVM